jgi:tRNA A-37 threonylcarbamoyl transferase component Bud32/tetratricopeptide (TPR) repeat protein
MDDLRSRLEQALGGNYTFERELGGGGMSRTYLARDTALNRQVVVKVLAPELLAGLSVERFRREILLAAQLQHPHVVPVLTAGDVDGIPWFTMPYVEGNSLRLRIDAQGIPLSETVSILRDVARALTYAHARGIVHRDIKPDNVLLSAGSATVTDFGIAKAINAARTDAGVNETLTQVGTSIGTPTYMAPEQALGDPDTDHRADIYAFGVMAYEMLAGRPPFHGSNPSKVLAAHLGEPAADIAGIAVGCPPALAALVMQCLEKDPDKRPQEASQVARALDSITTSGTGTQVPAILQGGRIPLGKALALWFVASVLVVVTAWAARSVIGLPDWVLPGALGVMLAGLPVLAATAYVQRTTHRAFTMTPGTTTPQHGTMATLALKASPHLSWKRAWTGGAVAVGGFAVLVIGFMVLRALGMGPMGSLQGKGIFGANETLVVADFLSPSADSMLGMTVAEALRTDLAQSNSLRVLSRATLRENLTLMRRAGESRISYDLAREIATREGAKAVLDGEVTQLGQGYVISARLVATLYGTELATFREVAENEDDLIATLGDLSKSVRERSGESLRSIQATSELTRVTTGSLAALRKYVEGNRLVSEEGEQGRGLALLEQAVELDSTFAMAWRKIAVTVSNMGLGRARVMDAATKAYQFRENLTEEERLLTEAYYWSAGPEPSRVKSLEAYDALIARDSSNGTALNNSALALSAMGRWVEAEERYRLATLGPRAFTVAFGNRLSAQIMNGRPVVVLDSTIALMRERLPGNPAIAGLEASVAWAQDDLVRFDSILRAERDSAGNTRAAIGPTIGLASLAELQGRHRDARQLTARGRAVQGSMNSGSGLGNQLRAALDTVVYEALYGGNAAVTRAALAAVLQRIPLDSLQPIQRPYGQLAFLGAWLRDPALVMRARDGWLRDQAEISIAREGNLAEFEGLLAMAEERWEDALAQIEDSERLFGTGRLDALRWRALIFDQLDRPDSALLAWERVYESRGPVIGADAYFRPVGLQRLGELHEANGNAAKAIEYYGKFVELWRNADPELQPRVAEIRERMARLQRQEG